MGEILGTEAVGEIISCALSEQRLSFPPETGERLAVYHHLLCDWNTRMNLTGDTRLETALSRLYLDSLAPLGLPGLFPEGASLIDVGTGAGFPGMALAIARPDLQVTLLDSLQKRLTFLSAVRQELGLSNVTLVHARAEDGGRDPLLRERFDIACARAVASLPVLCELLLPFVRVGGTMMCYKGPAAEEELAASGRASRILGGGGLKVIPVPLVSQPDWQHCLVCAQKNGPTGKAYPRKAGTPGAKPLGGV